MFDTGLTIYRWAATGKPATADDFDDDSGAVLEIPVEAEMAGALDEAPYVTAARAVATRWPVELTDAEHELVSEQYEREYQRRKRWA